MHVDIHALRRLRFEFAKVGHERPKSIERVGDIWKASCPRCGGEGTWTPKDPWTRSIEDITTVPEGPCKP